MPKYKVFYQRVEIEEAIIEAESAEKAEELADNNYSDYSWSACDGTLSGEILDGETEEVEDE